MSNDRWEKFDNELRLIVNVIRLPITIFIRAPLMIICFLLAVLGERAAVVCEWARENLGGWE